MKLRIDKASLINNSKPCKEAVKEGDHWIVTLRFAELVGFIKKHGAVIVYPPNSTGLTNQDYWMLTIYDSYIE